MSGKRISSSVRESITRALCRRTRDTDGSLSNELARELAATFGVSASTVRRIHDGFHPTVKASAALTVDQKVAVVRFAGNLRAAHRWLADHDQVDVAYREFVYRFHRLDPLEQIGLRKGAHAAAGMGLALKQTTERKLQRLHFDHTMFDIDVAYRNSVGRPWASLLLDAYTRMIVAAALVFGERIGGDPNTATVIGLLAGAMTGWEHEGTRYGGIPEAVWYDNALAHLATAVTNGFTEYGVAGHAIKKASPWQNGKAEAVVDTATTEFITALPGHVNSLPDRFGRPGAKLLDPDEMLQFSEFHWLFERWVDHYNFERVHSAIGMTPAEMWALDSTPVEFADPDDVRHLFAADAVRRKVGGYGVRFDGVDFINEQLCRMVGLTVEVRHIPGRLDFVHCYDTEGNYLGEAHPHHKLTQAQRAKVLRLRERPASRVSSYIKKSNAVRQQDAAKQRREAQIIGLVDDDDSVDEDELVALWDQIIKDN